MPSYFDKSHDHGGHQQTGGALRRWLLTLVTVCGLLFCSSVPARADMIRDAEIEAGLEQLVAPLSPANAPSMCIPPCCWKPRMCWNSWG